MKKISFGEDGRTHRFFGDFTAHLGIDKLQLVRENQAARMPKIPQEALPGLLKTDLSSGRKPRSSPTGLELPQISSSPAALSDEMEEFIR